MERNKDLRFVFDMVNNEGLEHSVTSYVAADSIIDHDVSEAWALARQALVNLRIVLVRKGWNG